MTLKRFAISSILASVLMLLMSFVWHGLILNDFRNISYNFGYFIFLSAFVYLLISFLLSMILRYVDIKDSALSKSALIGGAFGFFIYLIVFTLGISYHARGIEHIVIDFSWQMLEQACGALVVGLSFRVYERMDAISD